MALRWRIEYEQGQWSDENPYIRDCELLAEGKEVLIEALEKRIEDDETDVGEVL